MDGTRQLKRLTIYAALNYPFVCVPFLYFHFRDHGVTIAQYHAMIAVYYAAMVVAEVPTGLLADRFGKRLALWLGPLVLGAGYLTLARGHTYATFCAGQAVLGLGHSIISGPPTALLYDTLTQLGRRSDFLRFESRLHAIRLLGTAVAFLSGGFLVAWVGIVPAIYATIALHCLGCFVALSLCEERGAPGEITMGGILRSARQHLLEPSVLWISGYFVLLFCLLRYCFHTYQPFLEAADNRQPLFVGAFYCGLNVLAAPFSKLGATITERHGMAPVFWSMPLALAVSLLLMAGSVNPLGIFLMCVHQAPLGMHWGLIQSWVNHRIQPIARATVLSAMSFLGRLAFAILFVPIGLLHEARGVTAAYLTAGIAGIAATIVCMLLGRRFLEEQQA